jgi:hypothetical protein
VSVQGFDEDQVEMAALGVDVHLLRLRAKRLAPLLRVIAV